MHHKKYDNRFTVRNIENDEDFFALKLQYVTYYCNFTLWVNGQVTLEISEPITHSTIPLLVVTEIDEEEYFGIFVDCGLMEYLHEFNKRNTRS